MILLRLRTECLENLFRELSIYNAPLKVKSSINTIYLIFLGCAKNSLVNEKAPVEKLFSCVNFNKLADPNFDSNNLYNFWDIIVADASCSIS